MRRPVSQARPRSLVLPLVCGVLAGVVATRGLGAQGEAPGEQAPGEQAPGREAPASQPIVREEVLPNGIRVFAHTRPDDGFALAVVIGAGSRHESVDKKKTGLAHLLEHVLIKSGSRPFDEVRKDIEVRARGTYNGQTTADTTAFWVELADEHRDVAIEWLGSALSRPRLRAEDLEDERRIVLEELELRSPGGHVADSSESLIYPHHPIGRGVGGDQGHVAALTLQDLKCFHDGLYHGKNTVVGFAAPAERLDDCMRSIRKAFADMPATPRGRTAPESRPPENLLTGTRPVLGLGKGGQRSGALHGGYHVAKRTGTTLGMLLVAKHLLAERFFMQVREQEKVSYNPEVDYVLHPDAWRLDFAADVSDEGNLPLVRRLIDAAVASLPETSEEAFEFARLAAMERLVPTGAHGLVQYLQMVHALAQNGESKREPVAILHDLTRAAALEAARDTFVPDKFFLLTGSQLLAGGRFQVWAALGAAAILFFVVDGLRGFRIARRLVRAPVELIPAARRPRRRNQGERLVREIMDFYEQQDRRRW